MQGCTAVSPRLLIRMRPLVQVQPGPLHRADLGERSSVVLDRSCFYASPRHSGLKTHPYPAILHRERVKNVRRSGHWADGEAIRTTAPQALRGFYGAPEQPPRRCGGTTYRPPIRVAGTGTSLGHGKRSAELVGTMFWLKRRTLDGSYLLFGAPSRANLLSPYVTL